MPFFKAPHVYRCERDKDTKQFPDHEGFYMVLKGAIKFEDGILHVFECDESAPHPSLTEPVISITKWDVHTVHLTKFHSERRNYGGGQVRIIGVFDRGVEERITIQMGYDTYLDFIGVLKAAWKSPRQNK